MTKAITGRVLWQVNYSVNLGPDDYESKEVPRQLGRLTDRLACLFRPTEDGSEGEVETLLRTGDLGSLAYPESIS